MGSRRRGITFKTNKLCCSYKRFINKVLAIPFIIFISDLNMVSACPNLWSKARYSNKYRPDHHNNTSAFLDTQRPFIWGKDREQNQTTKQKKKEKRANQNESGSLNRTGLRACFNHKGQGVDLDLGGASAEKALSPQARHACS